MDKLSIYNDTLAEKELDRLGGGGGGGRDTLCSRKAKQMPPRNKMSTNLIIFDSVLL